MSPRPLPAARNLPVAPTKCSTCDALAQTPFACQDCHELLAHVQGADYFELFGLPRRYDLDPTLLADRYVAISRNIHPDKFATANDAMQSFALRASAAVNRAHDVLRNDILRAEYLLETSGGKSAAQDKRVPQDLLDEVLALREEIEEARAAGAMDRLSGIREEVTRRRGDCEARIARLCAGLPALAAERKDELRLQLNAMKYLKNLVEQIGAG